MGLPTPQEERYYEQLRIKTRAKYRQLNRESLVYPEIIFIGDSITEFFQVNQLLSTNRVLANRGISASRTDHILEHLDCHLFGTMVRQIILLIGVNDLGYGIAEEDIVANVRKLIASIKEDYPMVHISLLEILPINESEKYCQTTGLRTNQAINQLNTAYAHLTHEFQMVDLVVINTFFQDKKGQLAEDYTTDGLHLTAVGYELLAQLVLPKLL